MIDDRAGRITAAAKCKVNFPHDRTILVGKPEAFVVLADPTRAGPEMDATLLAHVKAGLAPYKYPRWFTYVEDLPKTATGKIQRYKLRASS